MNKVAFIDRDGVVEEVKPRNISDQIRKMFNLMLHYSQSNLLPNGRKVRIIRYDILTEKEDNILNTMRLTFNKKGFVSDAQFKMLVRLYRKVVEDIL